MSNPISFDSPELNVVASLEESSVALEPDTPFRILLLGDWSGRENRRLSASGTVASELRPMLIDRDNFDEVMARMGVALHLPLAGEHSPRFPLRFAELEDFHPDRLFAQLEIFASLKQTRERLDDPATFAEAAAEVRGWNEAAPQPAAATPTAQPGAEQSPPAASAPDGGNLLDQMLEEAQSRPSLTSPSLGDGNWDALLRDLVRPHLAPREDPQQDELVATVDETTSGLMRTILRHRDFQALEAAWRALFFMASRLETGTDLKLYLLDISKEELAAELSAAEDLRETPLFKLLVEQSVGTRGGELWSLFAGNYTFAQTREEIALLARLAKIARQAGAPFIAEASSRLIGCESLAATPDPADWQNPESENDLLWDALRRMREASYLGLLLPRFLLRLPYGAETEPTEEFEFSEMPGEPEHGAYLWGNPAFACAYLLAESYSRRGWDMGHGFAQEIEGLPLHIYEGSQGESQIKPCAETLLTERAAIRIMERGIMPLLSFKNTDTIRLARFQSLADPPTALAGRWN